MTTNRIRLEIDEFIRETISGLVPDFEGAEETRLYLDSFDLVMLASRIEEEFVIEVPPNHLFDGSFRSLSDVGELIERLVGEKGSGN